AQGHHIYWRMATLLIGAVITAFYTTRMFLKTFHGEYRGSEHLRESPRSMTAPLGVLAVATCFVGLLGCAPVGAPFRDWVYFGAPEAAVFSLPVALLSIVAVAVGIYSGWVIYRTYRAKDPT